MALQLNIGMAFSSFSLRSIIGVGAGVLLAAAASLLLFLAPAEAISCGEAECYVSSVVATNSSWEDGSTGHGGFGGSAGGNSTTNPSDLSYTYSFVACRQWFAGGAHVTTYPVSPRPCGNIPLLPICPALADRSATGWVNVYVTKENGGQRLQSSICLYPTDDYAPIERKFGEGKIYIGGRADFYQTGSASSAQTYNRSGTLTDSSGYVSRNVDLKAPEAYTGIWKPDFTGKTGKKSNGDPLYGYYRLIWDLDYRTCEKWGYPSWIGHTPRYDCSRGGQDRLVETYTYACNLSPAIREGIAVDADFRPSACEESWSCSVPDSIRLNHYASDLSTMRNGVPLIVDFPSLNVTTPNSSYVRNVRQEQINVSVVDGSTPWNNKAADANSHQQYFAASWTWGQWESLKPGDIRFYWAGSPDRPFRFKVDYRFTADFSVFAQDSLSSGTVKRFAADTVQCGSESSAAITVLRAISESG